MVDTWPPPQRRAEAEKLIARGMVCIALIVLGCAAVLVVVPQVVTIRHMIAAGVFTIPGLLLLHTAWRLHQLTRGRGRRRA